MHVCGWLFLVQVHNNVILSNFLLLLFLNVSRCDSIQCALCKSGIGWICSYLSSSSLTISHSIAVHHDQLYTFKVFWVPFKKTFKGTDSKFSTFYSQPDTMRNFSSHTINSPFSMAGSKIVLFFWEAKICFQKITNWTE